MAFENDTAKRWGFMENGVFRPLPKIPMLRIGLGPPPFDVEMPSGEIRHIVEEPEAGFEKVQTDSSN
jgi:hypothetical protein